MGTGQPLPLGLAILGSQLPDLDTTTSTIGKIFFPISSWIEDRFPHRSITHSLLATAAITAVSLGANYFWLHGDIKSAIALLTLGIYLANGGGITQKVSQNLGLRDGIVRVYTRLGNFTKKREQKESKVKNEILKINLSDDSFGRSAEINS